MATVTTEGGETLFQVSDDTTIADVYKAYEDIENPSFEGDKAAAFRKLLSAAKGAAPALQKLIAEWIPKFFERFPTCKDEAIHAQIDLCETETPVVRMSAINGLSGLCGTDLDSVRDLTNMVSQLMLNAVEAESAAAAKGVNSLLSRSVEGALTALFSHIKSSEEEGLRAKIAEYITARPQLNHLRRLLKTDEQQQFFLDQLTSVGTALSPEQFKILFRFASTLKLFRSKEALSKLVEVIENQANVAALNAASDDDVAKFNTCLTMALPFFRKGADSSKWVQFLVGGVVPNFGTLRGDVALAAAKHLGDLAPTFTATVAVTALPAIYAALKGKLPGEPTVDEAGNPVAPNVDYSMVECLLYAFHGAAKHRRSDLQALCGLRATAAPVWTGQPQDIMGNDSSNDAERAAFTGALKRLVPLNKQFQKKFITARDALNKAKDQDVAKRKLVNLAISTTRNVGILADALLKDTAQLVHERVSPSWRPNNNNNKKGGKKGENKKGENKKGGRPGQGAGSGAGAGSAQGKGKGGKGKGGKGGKGNNNNNNTPRKGGNKGGNKSGNRGGTNNNNNGGGRKRKKSQGNNSNNNNGGNKKKNQKNQGGPSPNKRRRNRK